MNINLETTGQKINFFSRSTYGIPERAFFLNLRKSLYFSQTRKSPTSCFRVAEEIWDGEVCARPQSLRALWPSYAMLELYHRQPKLASLQTAVENLNAL